MSKYTMKHIPQAEGSPALTWGPGGFSPEQNNPGNPGVSLSTVYSTLPPPSICRGEGSEAAAGFGPGTGPAIPLSGVLMSPCGQA